MKNFSPKRFTLLLVGLTFLLSLTSLSAVARTTSKHSRGVQERRLKPGRALPAIEGPINPNDFWCEWKRGSDNAAGMATVTMEFTRAMPQNGWRAVLHNRYPNGGSMDQEVQLYNPQPAYNTPTTPAVAPKLIGTDWDFQTTDGKLRCKVFVSTSKGEIRFSACSNGNSQYCVTQGLFEGLGAKTCGACSAGDSISQAGCLSRCMDEKLGDSGVSQSDFCRQYPVSCLSWLTVRFMKRYPADATHDPIDLFTFERLGFASVDRQKFVREVLRAMYQGWIDFVNSELGPCVSSHYCPAGTNCGGGGKCEVMFGTP